MPKQKELLSRYCRENYTSQEIAVLFGRSRNGILSDLKKFNLSTNFKQGQVKNKGYQRGNTNRRNIKVTCSHCHQTKYHKCSNRLPKDGGWSTRRS